MFDWMHRFRFLALGLGMGLTGLSGSAGLGSVETGSDRRPRVSDLIERAEVRVLLVDVFVTAADGNPVSGLAPEDFRLFIDKKQVSIDSFESREVPLVAPGRDTPSVRAAPAAQVPFGGQRVVMFFDSNNSKVLEQQRVRERTLQALEDSILPTDEVMVLSFGTRLRVVQPFTSEKTLWIAAVRSLVGDRRSLDSYMDGETGRIDRVYDMCLRAGAEARAPVMAGPGAGAASGSRPQGAGSNHSGGGAGSPPVPGTDGSGGAAMEGPCGATWVAADHFMTEELNRASQTLAALKGTVMAMRGMPGRKAVVFLSQGIRPTPGEEYYIAASCSACAGSKFRSSLGQYNLQLEIEDLYREANDSNVTIHAIDTRTSRNMEVRPMQWKPGDPTEHPEARWDFLSNLALQTGGMRGGPSETLANRFQQLEKRMANYYVLGHTLPDAEPDGEIHKLRVEIDRDRTDLHYRRSFRDADWRDREENTLQGALFLPEACRDLPIAARVLDLNVAGRKSDAFIEMGLPFTQLSWIPTAQGEFSEVEFAGAVVDASGRIQHRFRDWLELKRKPDDAENGDRGVYFRERTSLGPGEYELRAVVHDLGGGRLGGTRVEFLIPDPENRELTLSTPALGRLSRGDMVIGAAVPFASGGKGDREYRQEQVVPLLGEEISRGEILVTFVQISDPAPDRSEEYSDYSVAVMFVRDGEVVGRHRPVRVEEPVAGGEPIPFAIYSSLQRFEPGEYSVRIEVVDEASDRKVSREVPLRIR